MDHKKFQRNLKKSESGFFFVSFLIVLFLWVSLLAAFLARSWVIVFMIGGLVTIWIIASTSVMTKTYEGYLFMSYVFDDVVEKVKKMDKKTDKKRK